ncbi:hypothetical protein PIB30_090057 [Stylosanthes scabra]|uniref:Uncharacterized protein n=1 Tax=Stylosanthes scabra TaxID=79078 RepID=A0ABU6RUW9_9FABA|nr:hypothetical protein [Stylosanthes scabra]
MAVNSQGDGGMVVREVEAAQMLHELPSIYRWIIEDVLGAPSVLTQEYLDEMKLSRQRLLNRPSVAPSQLHPNAWSSIRCFELVTEFFELSQDPEVFLYLFNFYSSNTAGKTKKGYMSVRSGKNWRIFGLYEDFFHDFKGRYFKIFPVEGQRPFWESLEGDGRFSPFCSLNASFDIVIVTYQRLNADQKDVADILTFPFSKNNLAPKSIFGRMEESQKLILRWPGTALLGPPLSARSTLPGQYFRPDYLWTSSYDQSAGRASWVGRQGSIHAKGRKFTQCRGHRGSVGQRFFPGEGRGSLASSISKKEVACTRQFC